MPGSAASAQGQCSKAANHGRGRGFWVSEEAHFVDVGSWVRIDGEESCQGEAGPGASVLQTQGSPRGQGQGQGRSWHAVDMLELSSGVRSAAGRCKHCLWGSGVSQVEKEPQEAVGAHVHSEHSRSTVQVCSTVAWPYPSRTSCGGAPHSGGTSEHPHKCVSVSCIQGLLCCMTM